MKVKKILILCLFLFISGVSKAQESYSRQIKKAIRLSNQEDSLQQHKALLQYEEAFHQYPDSINDYHMYKASLLANELKEKDYAFKYVSYLSELIEDSSGYPGWDYVLGKYTAEDYSNLLDDQRWKKLKEKALLNKEKYFRKLKNAEEEFFQVKEEKFDVEKKASELYQDLRNSKPYLTKKQQNYSISFSINDSTKNSYFVHLPLHYNPSKKYPVLFFLHGAIGQSELMEYHTSSVLKFWNRFYTKYADQHEVILVFTSANRQYNWLTDKGFFMVPEILRQLKKFIHVDDNKVFVTGHSNGATGSFSYLMKQANLFAGFYGFNTKPELFTGGTFIENILNRSFINFSTDQDYYYPPQANDSLVVLCNQIHADYKDYRYNGFPHWFPEFDESEPAYQILFKDLLARKREAFPTKITWEFDDERYAGIDWIKKVKLDTLQEKKAWHKELNFPIKKWKEYNDQDSLVEKNVDKMAFKFPRKSGKIVAEYDRNTFHIECSRVSSFTILLSPEMLNLKKKIKVIVNGKLLYNKKSGYNKEYMIHSFIQNQDRQQIWVNEIEIKI